MPEKHNLNKEIFLSAPCNFVLVLVTIPAVVTSEPPTLAVNSNELFEINDYVSKKFHFGLTGKPQPAMDNVSVFRERNF